MSKVPAVVLSFWILKIVATTLGETGGDALSMSLDLGYALSSALLLCLFAAAVAAQMRARSFHPALYWSVIVATTMAGTTMADFADRSLGIGYTGGVMILFAALMAALASWRWRMGAIQIDNIAAPRVERFYWTAILLSQTLGTALGDWAADTNGLGYAGGTLLFGAALAIVAAAYLFTRISHVLLFWTAFILTRPLGATLGDFLDKPLSHGGLALSRFAATATLAAFMVLWLLLVPQRAGSHGTPVQPAP